MTDELKLKEPADTTTHSDAMLAGMGIAGGFVDIVQISKGDSATLTEPY